MKLCEICRKNPASISIHEFVNGEQHAIHLCGECAKKRNLTADSMHTPALQQMLARITEAFTGESGLPLSNLFGGCEQGIEDFPDILCSVCGTDTRSYLKTGRLGCAACYDTFFPLLEKKNVLLQHGRIHLGKTPPESEVFFQKANVSARVRLRCELERLKKSLEESVQREEFELAAELRDQIAETEIKLAKEPVSGTSQELKKE